MSLSKPVILDGGFSRPLLRGDVLGGAETVAALTTAGAGTLLAALLTAGILNRTGPTGAVADTVDTADNILAYIANANPGDTVRLRYINNVAFAITVTGVTGVTITNGIVNAASVKDFLLTLVNATRASISTANTTNASAIVTGMTQDQTSRVSSGQLVSGTGISGSTTVLSVQPGVGVTLSANATATNTLVALTFSPVVTILGLGQGLL